jgi:hypothetical protein
MRYWNTSDEPTNANLRYLEGLASIGLESTQSS